MSHPNAHPSRGLPAAMAEGTLGPLFLTEIDENISLPYHSSDMPHTRFSSFSTWPRSAHARACHGPTTVTSDACVAHRSASATISTATARTLSNRVLPLTTPHLRVPLADVQRSASDCTEVYGGDSGKGDVAEAVVEEEEEEEEEEKEEAPTSMTSPLLRLPSRAVVVMTGEGKSCAPSHGRSTVVSANSAMAAMERVARSAAQTMTGKEEKRKGVMTAISFSFVPFSWRGDAGHPQRLQLACSLLPVCRELFVRDFHLRLFHRPCETPQSTQGSEPTCRTATTAAAACCIPSPAKAALPDETDVVSTFSSSSDVVTQEHVPTAPSSLLPPSPPAARAACAPSALPTALSSSWCTPNWQCTRAFARFERAVQQRTTPWRGVARCGGKYGCTNDDSGSAGVSFPSSTSSTDASSYGETCPLLATPRSRLWSPVHPPGLGRCCPQSDVCNEGAGEMMTAGRQKDLAADADAFDKAALWAAEQMCSAGDTTTEESVA
ncbi:hypothetical protein N2W54_005420 [Lotmaria passim]